MLIYTFDDHAACYHLQKQGLFDDITELLASYGIPSLRLNFKRFHHFDDRKDDPRYEFHQRMRGFAPLFALVPKEAYYDYNQVDTQRLINQTRVYNGIIGDDHVKSNIVYRGYYKNNFKHFIEHNANLPLISRSQLNIRLF